jgi:hypothetical protein
MYLSRIISLYLRNRAGSRDGSIAASGPIGNDACFPLNHQSSLPCATVRYRQQATCASLVMSGLVLQGLLRQVLSPSLYLKPSVQVWYNRSPIYKRAYVSFLGLLFTFQKTLIILQ